jgi:predicted Ser/Thr protein kinase
MHLFSLADAGKDGRSMSSRRLLKQSLAFLQLQRSFASMLPVKDTVRSIVRIGFDGSVHKTFRGHLAKERFENECRVLKHLETAGCDFVPRLIHADADTLSMVTTNCGARVDQLREARMLELFAELEGFGVRHDDVALRNVTYRASDGRFCLIDFEFATILGQGGLTLEDSLADPRGDSEA